jgi:hypothetical protein
MRSLNFGQNQGKNFKMKSRDNISTSGSIPFPANSLDKTTPVTDEDRAVAREHDAELREICQDTSRALQEIRQWTGNLLLDTLAKLDLDLLTLVQVLDERPSVVRDLMDGDFENVTTEKIIENLEKLRR